MSDRTHKRVGWELAEKLTSAFARTTLAMLVAAASVGGGQLYAQAIPTASAPGLLQIGGMFSSVNSDYGTPRMNGYGFYADFDFKPHLGIEGEFHQANDTNPVVAIYERTYEIGPRYVRRYGRVAPYAKLLYGRGVFNYPPVFGDPNGGAAANLAYNLGAAGAGVDYRLTRSFNVRGDYEYQWWFGFPPNDLTPSIISVGFAYQFH